MDRELVVRAQAGDEVAFAAITGSAHGRLKQIAYRFLVNACDREAKRHRESYCELPGVVDTSNPDGSGAVNDRDQPERGFKRLSADHRAVGQLRGYGLRAEQEPVPDHLAHASRNGRLTAANVIVRPRYDGRTMTSNLTTPAGARLLVGAPAVAFHR